MKKYFQLFIKNNHIKVSTEKSKGNFLCIDRGRPNQALLSSIYTVLINRRFNFTPYVVTDYRNKDIIKLYKSFGLKNFITGFKIYLLFVRPLIFIKSFILTIKFIFLIKEKGFHWFIYSSKICDIKIGDLIYDYYIRNGNSYLNPSVDIKFIKVLFRSLFRIFNISNIIKTKNIKYIIINTETYAHNDGVALRFGLKKKIPVIEPQLMSLDFFRYEKKHITHGKNSIFYNNKLKTVKNFEKKKSKIDNFLNKRFLGKANTGYTQNKHLKVVNDKSKMISRNEYLKINSFKKEEIKKIILFSCHALSDANHGLASNFLFLDYFDHIKKTLEYVNKINNPNILWILRPNPTTESQEEYADLTNLVKKFNNKKIIMSQKNVTSFNYSKICDNVITGRGTVGLEFACLGKYALLAGSGVYSNLGIALEFKNKKKYFDQLRNIESIKKISEKKILLAKKILYYLEHTNEKFFLEKFNNKEKNIFIKNSKFLLDESFTASYRKDIEESFFNKKLISNLKNFRFDQNKYIDYFFNKF